MSRLPRPNPTVEVRCRVVLRQLGGVFVDDVIKANRFVPRVTPSRSLSKLLHTKLTALAGLLKCEVSDLRLDHTWALENRPKRFKNGVHVDYYPPANDPEWLAYRPQGTQFAGSHDVKTRVRGDNGQLSDNALAKKERRRLKKLDPHRRKAKIAQRKNPWPKNRRFR